MTSSSEKLIFTQTSKDYRFAVYETTEAGDIRMDLANAHRVESLEMGPVMRQAFAEALGCTTDEEKRLFDLVLEVAKRGGVVLARRYNGGQCRLALPETEAERGAEAGLHANAKAQITAIAEVLHKRKDKLPMDHDHGATLAEQVAAIIDWGCESCDEAMTFRVNATGIQAALGITGKHQKTDMVASARAVLGRIDYNLRSYGLSVGTLDVRFESAFSKLGHIPGMDAKTQTLFEGLKIGAAALAEKLQHPADDDPLDTIAAALLTIDRLRDVHRIFSEAGFTKGTVESRAHEVVGKLAADMSSGQGRTIRALNEALTKAEASEAATRERMAALGTAFAEKQKRMHHVAAELASLQSRYLGEVETRLRAEDERDAARKHADTTHQRNIDLGTRFEEVARAAYGLPDMFLTRTTYAETIARVRDLAKLQAEVQALAECIDSVAGTPLEKVPGEAIALIKALREDLEKALTTSAYREGHVAGRSHAPTPAGFELEAYPQPYRFEVTMEATNSLVALEPPKPPGSPADAATPDEDDDPEWPTLAKQPAKPEDAAPVQPSPNCTTCVHFGTGRAGMRQGFCHVAKPPRAIAAPEQWWCEKYDGRGANAYANKEQFGQYMTKAPAKAHYVDEKTAWALLLAEQVDLVGTTAPEAMADRVHHIQDALDGLSKAVGVETTAMRERAGQDKARAERDRALRANKLHTEKLQAAHEVLDVANVEDADLLHLRVKALVDERDTKARTIERQGSWLSSVAAVLTDAGVPDARPDLRVHDLVQQRDAARKNLATADAADDDPALLEARAQVSKAKAAGAADGTWFDRLRELEAPKDGEAVMVTQVGRVVERADRLVMVHIPSAHRDNPNVLVWVPYDAVRPTSGPDLLEPIVTPPEPTRGPAPTGLVWMERAVKTVDDDEFVCGLCEMHDPTVFVAYVHGDGTTFLTSNAGEFIDSDVVEAVRTECIRLRGPFDDGLPF